MTAQCCALVGAFVRPNEWLEVLLEQGGDPEAKDRGGWTPLIYAAYAGHLECVKAILETGASIKAKDKHKHTAYDWAMYLSLIHI